MLRHSRTLAIGGVVGLALAGCGQNPPQSSAPSSAPPPQASAPPSVSSSTSASGATIYNGLTMAQLKAIFAASGKTATEIQTGYLRLQDGPIVQLTQCPANENGTCYEIQIERTFSNVKPTVQAVNQWNLNTKVPEASVDSSGNLHMEFWVTTVGMTDQLLLDSIGWFEGAWQDPDGQQFWQPYMTSGAGS